MDALVNTRIQSTVNSTSALSSQGGSSRPTIEGTRITFPTGDWFEVQSATSYNTMFEGRDGTSIPHGEYNIINHTTGERFENVVVGSQSSNQENGLLASSGIDTQTTESPFTTKEGFNDFFKPLPSHPDIDKFEDIATFDLNPLNADNDDFPDGFENIGENIGLSILLGIFDFNAANNNSQTSQDGQETNGGSGNSNNSDGLTNGGQSGTPNVGVSTSDSDGNGVPETVSFNIPDTTAANGPTTTISVNNDTGIVTEAVISPTGFNTGENIVGTNGSVDVNFNDSGDTVESVTLNIPSSTATNSPVTNITVDLDPNSTSGTATETVTTPTGLEIGAAGTNDVEETEEDSSESSSSNSGSTTNNNSDGNTNGGSTNTGNTGGSGSNNTGGASSTPSAPQYSGPGSSPGTGG